MSNMDDFVQYGFGAYRESDFDYKPKRTYRPGIKNAPSAAQREQRQAFLDAREHRTVVMRTHPDAIRVPYASRQAIYLSDESDVDTGWPLE